MQYQPPPPRGALAGSCALSPQDLTPHDHLCDSLCVLNTVDSRSTLIPSFGSQQMRSHSDLSPEGLWPVDSAPKRSYHCYFHYAREFDTPVLAHLLDSLVRVSRRGKEIHFANITSSYETSLSPSQDKKKQANSCKIVSPETNPCWPTPSHSVPVASNRENMTEQDTGFLRFPFSNFRYSLTLFSKFFASFPHGTCTLSVSHRYLALDGIYHQI